MWQQAGISRRAIARRGSWTPPPGLVTEQGTGVRLNLADPLSPLTDRGYVESAIRRHYQPLLDPACDAILGELYPRGVSFEVNGDGAVQTGVPRRLKPPRLRSTPDAGASLRRLGYLYRRRRAAARRSSAASRSAPTARSSSAAGTGSEYHRTRQSASAASSNFRCSPHRSPSIRAISYAPGQRGAAYLAARKAIQEVVQRQLAAWGDAREQPETARPRCHALTGARPGARATGAERGFPVAGIAGRASARRTEEPSARTRRAGPAALPESIPHPR